MKALESFLASFVQMESPLPVVAILIWQMIWYNKYMKVCGKCKIEKPEEGFWKRSAVSHGLSTWCKKCHSEYDRDRYKNSKSERDRKKRNQARNIKKSQDYIINYLLANPCVDCGEKDPVVLEFDHINPEEKISNVSELMKFSINKVIEEIKKCEVRCANCHRRKTAEQFKTWKTFR